MQRSRALSAGVLVAPLLWACTMATAQAASQHCQISHVPDPHIEVVAQPARAVYDFTKDANEIHEIAVRSNSVEDGGTTLVRGLTVSHFGYIVDGGIQGRTYLPDMGPGFCTYPTQMTLTIGYAQPLTVYVEDNYPQGSCQSNAILEHENTHVRIMDQGLRDHLPAIRAALESALTDQALPIWSPDRDGGMARIGQQMKNKLEEAVADMMADEKARHAILDGEASKQRTWAECSRW